MSRSSPTHSGRLLLASPALPGATNDLTAARSHGIVDALTAAGLKCWADKAASPGLTVSGRDGHSAHENPHAA